MRRKGIIPFALEALAVAFIAALFLVICDSRRVFCQEENNNHTGKRWHYLYKISSTHKNADVLILGNSHAYCGLLPEQMSEQLGCTCFILASQGNMVTDSYYMLLEALKLVKPKLVVVETYTMRNYDQKHLEGVDLSCQFQSFENRRNLLLKAASTPFLFNVETAPYAWSRTLRNHSYIFDNPKLLQYNLSHPKAPLYRDKSYLGRYIRFTTGLEAPTLAQYESKGAPVDGRTMTMSPDAVEYTAKIVDLCHRKGIAVMFLTVPMYHSHVSYPEVWEQNLSQSIGDIPWLNLQDPAFDEYFTPDCFENTYKPNQHQTSTGAMRTSWFLCEFISMNALLKGK